MNSSIYTKGQKLTLDLTFINKTSFETQYGTCFVINYKDEFGNPFTYKGTTPTVNEISGNKVTATVKIESYRGVETIYLQRIKVIGGKSQQELRLEAEANEIKEMEAKIEVLKIKRELELVELLASDSLKTLIGKEISFFGWQYDNSGNMFGKVISIERGNFNNIKITVEKGGSTSMESYNSFSLQEINSLITSGKYSSNRMLNSGMNVSIK